MSLTDAPGQLLIPFPTGGVDFRDWDASVLLDLADWRWPEKPQAKAVST